MFTGIIEANGRIEKIEEKGTNRSFWVSSVLAPELKIDQSLSHNGVCLTVESVNGNQHRVTAVQETLAKTSLGSWKTGHLINLERCLQMNGRLDGHIVQGHVDTVATLKAVTDQNGSWNYSFSFPGNYAPLIIEKGSICVDGISLTAFKEGQDEFTVTIIPYTYEHTNIHSLKAGNTVNLEFDMVGKYIARQNSLLSTH
jgi:riboflavin synthase